jgi:hypothetical protein
VEIAANNTIPIAQVVGDFLFFGFELFLSYAASYLLSNPFLDAGRSFFSRSATHQKSGFHRHRLSAAVRAKCYVLK